MPSDAEKPIVGLIYSESETSSNESRYMAYYLAGVLINTGYAKAALIGYRADGLPSDLHRQREELVGGHLRILPPGKTFRSVKDIVSVSVSSVQSVAAMGGDSVAGNNRSSSNGSFPLIAFCHWNELANCDVLIVTINGPDSESCTAKMVHVLQHYSQEVSPSLLSYPVNLLLSSLLGPLMHVLRCCSLTHSQPAVAVAVSSDRHVVPWCSRYK